MCFTRGKRSFQIQISLSCSCPELQCEWLVILFLKFAFLNFLSRFFFLVATLLPSYESLITRRRTIARQDRLFKKCFLPSDKLRLLFQFSLPLKECKSIEFLVCYENQEWTQCESAWICPWTRKKANHWFYSNGQGRAAF